MPAARHRATLVALALALVVTAAAPVSPAAPASVAAAAPREPAPRPPDRPRGIRAFMHALAVIESGGRYNVANGRTGAIGRYQILPSNWPAWARRYVGRSNIPPTSGAQEAVARGRLTDLYRTYRRWDLVAYWWLTGRDGRTTRPWSGIATRYVANVMAVYRRTSALLARRGTTIGDGSARIRFSGGWRVARHAAYGGGRVRYATRGGATATITFTGRAISWVGPMGPTRGRVWVWLDGRPLRQVTLTSARFAARRLLFEAVWPSAGRHTLTIRVLATPGRPTVAIDELIVRR
jgi:hypothetical protein